MALLTAGGAPAVQADITLPLVGVPVASVEVVADEPYRPGQQVDLAFAEGPTLRMTAVRSGLERGRVTAFLAGGGGGMGKAVAARYYQGIPARLAVLDLLREVGEVPGQIDLPDTLTRWVRPAGPAAVALQDLMTAYPDRHWRILPDGTLWIGQETWPAGSDLQILEYHPADGWYLFDLALDLLPGMQADVGRVVRVVHRVRERSRTEVWTALTA